MNAKNKTQLVEDIKDNKLSVNIDEANDMVIANNLNQIRNIGKVIKDALIEEKDYGTIPNIGDKKILFQSGADKIITLFGLKLKYNIVEKELTNKGWRILVEAQLFMKNGEMLSNAFAGHDPQSRNDSISANAYNFDRALKMTQKRAKVWAVKSIGGLSDTFVDDIGDTAVDQINKITHSKVIDLYKILYQDYQIKQDKVKTEMLKVIRKWNDTHSIKISELTQLNKDDYKPFVELIKSMYAK